MKTIHNMKTRKFIRSLLHGLLFVSAFFVFHSDASAGCSGVTCRDIGNGGCNSNEVSIPVCKAEKCDPYSGQRPFPCALSSEVEKCGDVSNFGSQCKNSAAECTGGTSSNDECAGKFCPTGKVFCKASQNNCPDLSTRCVAANAGCADYDANCASSCAAVNPDKPVYCKSSSQSQTCGTKNDAVCKASCASTDDPVEDVNPKKCTNSNATACCKAKPDDDDDDEDGGETASGLVPCGRTTGDSDQQSPCTLCHLFWGIRNIINFAMRVLTFLAFTCLVIAAIIYIVSAGNDSIMSTAKGFIKNILFGFAIVLLAWLMINVVITYIGVQSWGWEWSQPSCDTSSKQTSTTSSGTDNGARPEADNSSGLPSNSGAGITPGTPTR